MVYEGMETVVCDAEENDWLSVSYHEQKYANEGPSVKKTRRLPHVKFSKKAAIIVAAAVLCVAMLAAILFIDGGFSAEVFGAVKAAYSSTVFKPVVQQPATANVALPCNVTLQGVSEEGVATFSGGRAVTSFTAGKVVDVSENGVTVAMDDKTNIVYNGLTEVYVSANDVVKANELLGKYNGTFTASISVSGEAVKQVVGSESQLTWNV